MGADQLCLHFSVQEILQVPNWQPLNLIILAGTKTDEIASYYVTQPPYPLDQSMYEASTISLTRGQVGGIRGVVEPDAGVYRTHRF